MHRAWYKRLITFTSAVVCNSINPLSSVSYEAKYPISSDIGYGLMIRLFRIMGGVYSVQ